MNEQEKNKTLAEWAGFKYSPETNIWLYPNSNIECLELPSFLKDETACFAWLTPKLDRITLEWDSYAKDMWWVRVNGEYDATDKKLATALCNAIIKLLDEK